jgi:inosine/xanthosine triphosphatase
MKKIVIASKNPVKTNATLLGFEKMFPQETFEIVSVSAASGVRDQPMSDQETLQGALNRTENAEKLEGVADYWVGIEGGIQEKGADMEVFAWVVIKAADMYVSKGRTGSFFLPPQISNLIKSGIELGKADDIVFSRSNSKQSSGSVGILTGDVIDRTKYYVDAVIFALIPFKNKMLYQRLEPAAKA